MSKVTAMLDAAVAVIKDIHSLADSLQALVDAMSENAPAEKCSKGRCRRTGTKGRKAFETGRCSRSIGG